MRLPRHADIALGLMVIEGHARIGEEAQDISGAFRTKEGMATFCTIRSHLATLRSRDLLESLVLTFKGEPPEPILSG